MLEYLLIFKVKFVSSLFIILLILFVLSLIESKKDKQPKKAVITYCLTFMIVSGFLCFGMNYLYFDQINICKDSNMVLTDINKDLSTGHSNPNMRVECNNEIYDIEKKFNKFGVHKGYKIKNKLKCD